MATNGISDLASLNNPDKIADAAQRIYEEKYKAKFEPTHTGEFLVIDLKTGEAYFGKFPEDALQQARTQAPNGIFHLIRIGAPAAFRVSYSLHQDAWWDRSHRQAG
jgi:hypothetical protein